MTGFMVVFFRILSALSIVVMATRNLPTRRRQPAPPPPRTLRRPHKARQRAYYQRRIRHIQREHLLFVLFVLRQSTPPAPDV